MPQSLLNHQSQPKPAGPSADVSALPHLSFRYLIGTYDRAIGSCNAQDMARAQSAVLDLMAALDVPHSRTSHRLFLLFGLCLSRLQSADFVEAQEILTIIRDAWLNASEFKFGPAGRA